MPHSCWRGSEGVDWSLGFGVSSLEFGIWSFKAMLGAHLRGHVDRVIRVPGIVGVVVMLMQLLAVKGG